MAKFSSIAWLAEAALRMVGVAFALLGCEAERVYVQQGPALIGQAGVGAEGGAGPGQEGLGDDPDSGTIDAELACDAGERRCAKSGATVQVCSVRGRWVDEEDCESTCAQGVCTGSCRPGQRHCARGQTPEGCSAAGQWVAERSCPFACVGEGRCGGECRPSDVRCAEVDGAQQVQRCDARGEWTAQEQCAFACGDGHCTGRCNPGTGRCTAGEVPERCNELGSWERQPPCEFVCTDGGECGGQCRPGTADCMDNAPHYCDTKGEWQTLPRCVRSTCTGKTCAGECEPGERTCRGDLLGSCDPSGYFAYQECSGACRNNRCVECGDDDDCAQDQLCSDERCVAIRCAGPPINGTGTGAACCDSRCGVPAFEGPADDDPNGISPADKGCGQPYCGRSRAGPSNCCTGTIRMEGQSCKVKRSAPCWLSQ